MPKKKILTFIDWFLPGYKAGGPIRSMANIVLSLGDEYDYFIVTRNTDLAERQAYDEVEPNQWLELHGAHVYYLSADQYSVKKIRQLMDEREYDMLYLNSLFSPKFTLIPLLVKKYYHKDLKTVLAPRGMLGEGALKFKSLKKKLFLASTKWTGFFNGLRWHATTGEEEDRILKYYGNKNEIRIGQCLTMPRVLHRDRKASKKPGEARFFYIGRLSEHKNISYALEILGRHTFEGNITLDIFGALEEPDYHQKCMKLIESAKDNVKVIYHGPKPYDELRERIIEDFHFLLLPTKGESYSHAILDAWGCGCPAMVSDRTPWLDLETKKLGWNFDLEGQEKFIEQITKALTIHSDEYLEMAQECVSFVNSELCKPEIIENNRRVFA